MLNFLLKVCILAAAKNSAFSVESVEMNWWYCAAANVEWNSAEIERFQQAVVEYDKDFVKISQRVSFDTVLNEPKV